MPACVGLICLRQGLVQFARQPRAQLKALMRIRQGLAFDSPGTMSRWRPGLSLRAC